MASSYYYFDYNYNVTLLFIFKEDIIWFKIDENTHQSVIIFASEEDAKEENARRQEMRKQTIEETGHSMVEETMGPILSIMSEV